MQVCLDLDAKTIGFRKNGVAIVEPTGIHEGDAYCFAFEAYAGDAATIIGEEVGEMSLRCNVDYARCKNCYNSVFKRLPAQDS